jgi:alpha-galactosidase
VADHGDINPTWDRMTLIGFSQAGLAKYAGPGHWNDPDMLEVGNGKLTLDENRTHMSLWVLLAAPLLAGNDLSKMPPETAAILTNKEVIAIDQDPLGKQGDRVSAVGPVEIWAKPLKGGDKAVGPLQPRRHSAARHVEVERCGFSRRRKGARHLAGKGSGKLQGSYTVSVPRHGVVLLRLTK